MQTQKEFVYNVILDVYGEIDGKVELSKEQRDEVVEAITQGIMDKECSFSDAAWKRYPTRDKVKGYASSLLTNNLKKDTRLTAGVKYKPEKPGSKRGSSDDVIKTLKAYITTLDPEDTVHREIAEQAIEDRKKEIEAEKKKQVTIDISLLPADLQEKLGLTEEEESA